MVAITGESNIIKSCECCNVDLHAGEVLKEEHELPSTTANLLNGRKES